MTSSIDLIAFPGAPNLPIFTAIEKGFFQDFGVEVTLETTPSSAYQIEALADGRFQIGATAFDNVVAYREGQGAVEFTEPPDLFVFLGATQLELSLVVSPDVESLEDLAGRSLALDALGTGFAFVLYEMLRRAGLSEGDYESVSVGATPQRWESVRAGTHAGTLTIEPFTSVAAANGFRVLASSRDLFDRYQGGIFTASANWASQNQAALDGFVNGYREGLSWTLDAANYADGVDRLRRNMPAIKPGVVDVVMAKLLAEETGLTPGGGVDPVGMATVLALRSRYGRPPRELSDAEVYIDRRYIA